MTSRHWLLLATALAIVSSGIACTSLIGGKAEIPERRKFTLNTHPLNVRFKDSKRPYPYNVQVQKFTVPGTYDRNQIVFRLSDFEFKDDKWNIWADRPSKMITDLVEAYLTDVNLFTGIAQEYLDTRPDYILSGTVRAIERRDSGDIWYSHLSISWKLVDATTNELFWADEFNRHEELYQQDMTYTVESISQTMRGEIEKAIRDLDFKFANKLRQDSGVELLEQLIHGDNDTVTAIDDSVAAEYGPDADYELIPGTLAPE